MNLCHLDLPQGLFYQVDWSVGDSLKNVSLKSGSHYSACMMEEVPRMRAAGARRDKPGETIGIALSGGGSRAALYSLGVLLYLVHSKLNNQVRLISSVSGGSIVNAALSLAKDYSRLSRRDFDRFASRLANRLANKGIFFFLGWRIFLLTVVLTGVIGFFLLAFPPLLASKVPSDYWQSYLTPFLLDVVGAAIFFLFTIWLGRRKAQMTEYALLVADFEPKEEGFRSRGTIKLSEVNEGYSGRPVEVQADDC